MAAASLPGGALARIDWRDPLVRGFAISILVHVLVMLLRFAPPQPIRFEPRDTRLEVVLLNAKTATRPVAPDVLAQVDQEAGGDRERGRARSPLPAESRIENGEDLIRQQRRVAELEARQRQLLAAARAPNPVLERPDTPIAPTQGRDREDVERVIARLQAQIDQQITDYNKRPRRLTYGVNAVGVSYARYVSDWASRIERIGTERYPEKARGRLYDSLIITVEIDKTGKVVDVIVNKKSKYEVLNRAIKQIVFAGAPYEPFPAEMAREGDILQIVRTWTFTNGALQTSEVK